MDLIVFENNNAFVIAEFRNATPPLMRLGIPRLAPSRAQRAAGGGYGNKTH